MKRWENASTLAERLRLVMQEKGVTQAELARRTGLSTALISAMLRGNKGSAGGTTHVTVLRLKKALGVPWAFFDLDRLRKENAVSTREQPELASAEV